MIDSATDDTSLIELVVRAHTGALGELYDRYKRLVFSVALAVVGDRATAEEITLDVFVLVWQRASMYRPDRAKVSTWLTAIARHHAIDILRRQNVRPDSRSLSWDDVSPQAAHTVREMEENVELSLQRERVRAALSNLPADQQEALALAYFGGYTHQQISKLLNQSLGTVKTRIRLAMQKLRRQLQEEHPLADTSEAAKTAYRMIEQDK
jgi:RNA polymerase sigma-70 factor (ECF subfamily)